MDKKSTRLVKKIAWVVAAIVVILAISSFLLSEYYLKPMSEKPVLSEIQVAACYAANQGGTCFTKLIDLGLVSTEDCCKAFNYCCK